MLTIIGIIALVIFAKFIYDTYVTGQTQKNMSEQRKHKPEAAARLMNNKGLNINTDYKFDQTEIDISMMLISERLNCSIDDAKEEFAKMLREEIINDPKGTEQFVSDLRNRKYDESLAFKMDPDNTPSAIYHKWTIEFIKQSQEEKSISIQYFNNAQELFNKGDFQNSLIAISKGKSNCEQKMLPHFNQLSAKCKLELGLFTEANADIFNAIYEMEGLKDFENRQEFEQSCELLEREIQEREKKEEEKKTALQYLNEAEEEFRNEDYEKAIKEIEKGLLKEDQTVSHKLYKLQALIYLKLNAFDDAKSSIQKAVVNLSQLDSEEINDYEKLKNAIELLKQHHDFAQED